jgi:hypothetical protein
MWALDPVNSRDLIERLRRHVRDENCEVLWVGEGWRGLVEECHARLVAVFPEYELLNVKEKYGVLFFQAWPRPWAAGEERWTPGEEEALGAIVGEIQWKSESVCEWCGEPGELREWRAHELTLCDGCDGRFADPPYSRGGTVRA